MTGFDSKRNAAKAKLDDDDDTQVYADTLLIVYQRGFADGKKAAQRPWVGLTHQQTKDCVQGWDGNDAYVLCRAIEIKLKEKNNAQK